MTIHQRREWTTQMQSLFGRARLAQYLSDQLNRVCKEISSVTDSEVLDDAEQLDAWCEAAHEPGLRVRRSEAVVEIGEDSNGVRVAKLAIPFEGNRTLFEMQASTSREDLVGSLDPVVGNSWPRDNTPRSVRFVDPIGREATVEQVKTWAKAKADSLDQHLGWTDHDVQAHNQRVRAAAETTVAARKRELEQIATVNKGLAGGI